MDLIPLKPNQPTVTFIPIRTGNLPFFNLTNRKKDTPTDIKFVGEDEAGNPVRWEVIHHTSPKVGYAGIKAHQIWYLLIKPAIDASRLENGKIPEIIPLGGIRECLRMVGWSAGGRQARDLIRALTQIAFAGCVADLWFPTGYNEKGEPTFKQIKGRFTRMSVYAIGEQHLTSEELKEAQFDFDLEDSIYIKLDPLEIEFQKAETKHQKLIDNEYMFSVKPAGRRWYELLANKVFGAVKHKKQYFEVLYSWYIQHHHTLKRYKTKRRVTQQINGVIKDHIATGFLKKAEYRKIKTNAGEIDFVMRFYIGQEAVDSINRIKGYLLTKTRRKKQIAQKAEVKLPMPEENGDKQLKTETTPATPEARLIAYFIEQFFDGKTPPIEQGSKQHDQARKLIEQYGEDVAQYIVKFASKEAEKTHFKDKVQVFGAVLKYRRAGAENYENYQKSLKQKEARKKAEADRKAEEKQQSEKRELGFKLFNDLSEEKLKSLRKDFSEKLKNENGWWSKADITKGVQKSMFEDSVDSAIREFLIEESNE